MIIKRVKIMDGFVLMILYIFLPIKNKKKDMTQNEKVLVTFQTRVRQLVLRFQEVKKENADLYAMVDENEKRIKQLEEKLTQMEHDYQSLKMARMMEITDGDLEGAKDRVAKMIRDVNKCIAVLSDEK